MGLDLPIVGVESRSMVSGNRSGEPPLPTDRLPTSATASSEAKGIPPLVAEEEGGCQFQLEPPLFLSLPLFFLLPLALPRFPEKGLSEPLFEVETDSGASSFDVDFWALARRPDPEVAEWPLAGEDRLFPEPEKAAFRRTVDSARERESFTTSRTTSSGKRLSELSKVHS